MRVDFVADVLLPLEDLDASCHAAQIVHEQEHGDHLEGGELAGFGVVAHGETSGLGCYWSEWWTANLTTNRPFCQYTA